MIRHREEAYIHRDWRKRERERSSYLPRTVSFSIICDKCGRKKLIPLTEEQHEKLDVEINLALYNGFKQMIFCIDCYNELRAIVREREKR
jgi:hypothetical protein